MRRVPVGLASRAFERVVDSDRSFVCGLACRRCSRSVGCIDCSWDGDWTRGCVCAVTFAALTLLLPDSDGLRCWVYCVRMSVNLKSKPFIHNYPNVCFLFGKTDDFKTMRLVFPVSIKSHTFYKILLTNLIWTKFQTI